MNKKIILIVGGVAAIFMLCACVAAAGFLIYNADKQKQQANIVLDTPAPVEPTDAPVPSERPTKAAQPTAAEPSPTHDSTHISDTLTAGRDAANEFLNVLADKNFDKAMTLVSKDLKSKPETQSTIESLVVDKGLQPHGLEWLKSDEDTNKQEVYLDGVMNTYDKRRGEVQVELTYEDGAWKVYYLNMATKGESVDPGPLSKWTNQRKKEELAFAKGGADYFMSDWVNGDYGDAWYLTAQPMKDSLDNDQAKLEKFIKDLNITPYDWLWENPRYIEVDGRTQPVIELIGDVRYQDGKRGPLTIQLAWEDGLWNVLYMKVNADSK